MRKFYDLTRLDSVSGWDKKLGFERILTASDWVDITGKKSEARKRAKKARADGKIPVFVAGSIEQAKEGSWVKGTIMEIRTRIDMQVVNIMAEKNVTALITLNYLRSDWRAIVHAADAIRLLHKGRVPILLATGAQDEKDLRAPREIAAVGKIIGMSQPQALAAVSNNWEVILRE